MAEVWEVYGASATPPCVMDLIPAPLHADILAGVSTADVSSYINSALAQYKCVRLPIVGQLSVGSTVFVPSGGAIYGYNYKCTIKALPNFGDNPVVSNANQTPTTHQARDKRLTLSGFRVDGNLDNNLTATEFAHGVMLNAVEGCDIDLEVVNVKGDGLCLNSTRAYQYYHVGNYNITGRIRTRRCQRQGVALICGEQISLDIFDEATRLMSLCIEPDNPENTIRNCTFRVHSIRTGDGTDISGGVACSGGGTGCIPTNIIIDFEVHEAGGYGCLWRDSANLTLRGSIFGGARGGLIGVDGGFGRSTVYFDGVRVYNPGLAGMTARETTGSIYDGSIYIEGAGTVGAQIENARGGILQLRVQNCRQDGVYLRNCTNMVFPNLFADGNNGHNVWLLGNSRGNRFPGMRSTSSNRGFGFLEETGCDDNKAIQARVAFNKGGAVSIAGPSSYVLPEA
jgi:hypothetical protein